MSKEKAERLVARDRYEAHAEAQVEGPDKARAAGNRMNQRMSAEARMWAYREEAKRQLLRERGFWERLWN